MSVGGDASDGLAQYLNSDVHKRERLDELVQEFCETMHGRTLPDIVCFYETQKTDLRPVINNLPSEFVKSLEGETRAVVRWY